MMIELPFPSAKLSSANARVVWTAERDEQLRRLHGTMPIPQVAAQMGTTRASIRARITKLGIRKRNDRFTQAEIAAIRDAYQGASFNEEFDLAALCTRLGRQKSSVSRQARLMGLTDISRPNKRAPKLKYKIGPIGSPELHAHMSEAARQRIAVHGHPRGMLGKRHAEEIRESLRATSKAWWNSMSKTEREAFTTRAQKAAFTKNGYAGAPPFNREGARWKAGWRDIGDKRHYFRSRWEANYARYLEWLKGHGDILEWEYEPETFWFDKIKRGVRSYLPDFRVHELNGAKILHEVKGWMDARSKTTLKRMAKYHPEVKIILIREKDYKALSRFSALIEGWE